MNTDVVIPFVEGPDNSVELRMALRSIDRNLGDVVVWIYGDAPKWIRGVNIVKSERKKYARFMKFIDQRRKIEMAAGNDLIGPRFIYTYDDIYFLKPVSIDDLRIPIARCNGIKGNDWYKGTGAGRNWIECMRNTLDALRKERLPMWSYETHLPRVYNREKVLALVNTPLLKGRIEPEAVQYATWYFNHYVTDPVLVSEMKHFKMIAGFNVPVDALKVNIKTHKILNANKYRPEVIRMLKEVFAEKSRFEE